MNIVSIGKLFLELIKVDFGSASIREAKWLIFPISRTLVPLQGWEKGLLTVSKSWWKDSILYTVWILQLANMDISLGFLCCSQYQTIIHCHISFERWGAISTLVQVGWWHMYLVSKKKSCAIWHAKHCSRYCTISINLAVTGHSPLRLGEMSQKSQVTQGTAEIPNLLVTHVNFGI